MTKKSFAAYLMGLDGWVMLADVPDRVKKTAGSQAVASREKRTRSRRATSRQVSARLRSCMLLKTPDSPEQVSVLSKSITTERWMNF